ncbi:hypothetical protein [Allorhizocola rhizosphaerae]|uniref:hypothetical protein n=1 Tax=Allorhizocola rhizosphaerae TaxID=1872709 RepID=UPI0013C32BBE|nr:hypothetical protein [Allorhizocola rhizosphaerae]
MRSRNNLLGLAAAALATVMLAGCVSDSEPPASASLQKPGEVGTADLRSVLLTNAEHPEGTQIAVTIPIWEAWARFFPGTGEPSGIVVYPRCVSYFSAIGGFESLEGWYQYGLRPNGALFVHFVAKAPRPQALTMIRMRVAGCPEGFQTIQGWPPSATGGGEIVTSKLAFTERKVSTLPEADAFGITQSITFHEPGNKLVQTIRQAWQCTDGPCNSYDAFVLKDGLLVWVHEGGDEKLADQMAKALHDRLGKSMMDGQPKS